MRKAVFPILFFLITTGVVVQATQITEWINYVSADGRYTVSLPAQPKVSQQEAKTAEGEAFQQYLATVQGAGVLYQVVYFDISPGQTFDLDKARNGMVGAVSGTLINERAIVLSGNPGREIKVAAKLEEVDYVLLARFTETNSRVYLLTAAAPKAREGETLNAELAKYFDSFQVLQK